MQVRASGGRPLWRSTLRANGRGGRRCGGRGTAAAIVLSRGYVAADKRGGGGVDGAAGWPRRLAPCADGHGLCRHGQAGRRGVGAEARRRGRASRVCGGTSLRRPRDDRGDQRPERTAVELCRHGRAARRGGGVEPRPRTEHRLGSGDAASQEQWPRQASPLECSDTLGWALHASESFLGDLREAFGDAKARKEPRRRTKRHLGADDAAGRAAAADAPDAPRQQPSMHTHSNWQGGRRGGFAPTGGAEAGPASSE